MSLLKSVEELLYELVTWILFYPLTLWRSLTQPLRMMRYAETELGDSDEGRFDDALSPPIFLLITIFLALLVQSSLQIGDTTVLPDFLQDQRNLLLYRGVSFSLFPLFFAIHDVRARRAQLNRRTLRAPFYGQCYPTAPFILVFSLTLIIAEDPDLSAAALPVFAAGTIWYAAVQVAWLRKVRALSWLRAIVGTLVPLLLGFLGMGIVVIATVLAGTA